MLPVAPLILSIALFMESMDATVIATALPAIARDLATTPVSLKLALTAYYVAIAVFVPLGAGIADRFGAVNVLRFAMAVFIAGSLGCAASQTLSQFVIARFVEGAGGALMAPVARVVLFRVTPRHQLVAATSWFTVPTVIAPMIGPSLGGLLTTTVGWPWIFLLNLPIAVTGMVLMTRYLPAVPRQIPPPIDPVGFATLALALAGTAFGVSMLGVPALPAWCAPASIGLGVVSGLLHARQFRRSASPVLDFRLFREPTFRATTIGCAILLLGCGALPFLTALLLQLGFGMTALEAGLVTLSGALGALVAKAIARRLFAAAGFRAGMGFGVLLAAVGIAVKATLLPTTPLFLIVLVLFINGLVRSIIFTGHAVLSVADVPETQVGDATAISIVMRQIASAFSVALAGAVLNLSASFHAGVMGLPNFKLAIACSAMLCLFAVPAYLRLGRHAGEGVSGRPRR